MKNTLWDRYLDYFSTLKGDNIISYKQYLEKLQLTYSSQEKEYQEIESELQTLKSNVR